MGRSGAKHRTELTKMHHSAKLAEMYLRGFTQMQMAEELGLSQPAVSLELEKIRARWRQATMVNFNEREQAELEKIDALEREYLKGYLESKQPKVTTTRKNVPRIVDREEGELSVNEDGDLIAEKDIEYLTAEETVREEQSPVGDARWLEGIQRCIDQRCKILGLYRTTPATSGQGDSGEAGQTIKSRVALFLGIFEQFQQNQDS